MIFEKKLKLIIGIILLILGFFIFRNNGERYNIYVLAINFIIVAISVFRIFRKDAPPFSLDMMFHLFNLFFIGIAPALQYKANISFMGQLNSLSDYDYLRCNIVFLVSITIYLFIYNKINTKHKKAQIFRKQFENQPIYNKTIVLVFISIASLLIAVVYFSSNFDYLIFRKALWNNINNYTSHTLAIVNTIRTIPLFVFIYYKLNYKRQYNVELILLSIIVMANFPTAIPRYKIALIYFPVILIYFRFLFKKYIFPVAFIINFLIVFPYFHHFRYSEKLIPENFIDANLFITGHFDTYQNTSLTISNNLITNGEQLFCTMLFFIPRIYWEDKCFASGHLLAETLRPSGFSNVAISFLGEGFVNFGYLGILIFILALSIAIAKIDFKFWHTQKNSTQFISFYLVFIPLVFLLLRGGLLTSYVNLFSSLSIILGLSLFLKKIK